MFSNRAFFIGIFFFITITFSNSWADSAPPLIRSNVEDAFASQDRINVLIKVRDPEIQGRSSRNLPVTKRIKRLQSQFADAFANEAFSGDIKIARKMHHIPWISARISREALERLRRHNIIAVIENDIPIYASLAQSAQLINADRANHTGYTGMGINVAVLDSGIDTDHPDLVNSLVWEECFLSESPCPVSGTDRSSGPGSAEDNGGHGSHVSGIITSDNEAQRGIAPKAGIVALKILNGSAGAISDLVAALDWVVENHQTYNIRIVNLSLGTFVYEGFCDNQNQSVADAADAVKAAGIALFAASGNKAADYRIDMPACLSSTISVGAVYDADVDRRTYSKCTDEATAPDQITCFSNVSTVLDLLAPGARITSTNRYGGTSVESGTSMACPHAAGLAALLLEENPELNSDELLTLMSTTGNLLYDDRIDMWFPRIDIAAALGIDVTAAPFSHDFDYVAPGASSSPKQFNITNTGTENILLGSISLNGEHPTDYHIIMDDCSGTLLSENETCTLTVQFTPTAKGPRRAEVLVPTDEPEAPQLAIKVKGWTGQGYFVNDAHTQYDIWCTAAGNDGSDGLTPDSPKATVQSVLADYDLEPGDVVFIDTGHYNLATNIEVTSEDGGDADHPVTFAASPYGVTFDRGNQTIGNYAWYIYQCDHVTLTTSEDDTYATHAKQWAEVGGANIGIYLYESNYIHVSNLSMQGNSNRDISASRSFGSEFNNNLFLSNSTYGLYLSSSDYATIHNNTMVGRNVYALRLDGSTNHAILKNNIIVAAEDGTRCIYKSDNATFDSSDYNLLLAKNGATIGYYGAYVSDLVEWQTASGLDAHSMATEPLFVGQLLSDYHLSPSSPAIDAGDPASDCALEPRPNGDRINMGAYGGTSEAATSTIGDFDGDGDVDGDDLYHLVTGGNFGDLMNFAVTFGR